MKARDCIVNETTALNGDYDRITNDLVDFANKTVKAIEFIRGENPIDRYTNKYKSINSADDLSKELINIDKINDVANAPDVVKRTFALKMEAIINELNLSRKDYSAFMEDVAVQTGFKRYVDQMFLLRRAEAKVSNMFLITGKNSEIKFDLLSNKSVLFTHHPIIKKLYADYQLFNNEMRNGIELHTHNFKRILSAAHKQLGLKVKTISELMTYYDNKYVSGQGDLQNRLLNSEDHDIKSYIKKELKQDQNLTKTDIVDGLIKKVKEFAVDPWFIMNYGTADLKNYDTKESWKEYPNSYAYFQHNMNNKLLGIMNSDDEVITKYGLKNTFSESYEKMKATLKEFQLRTGFVPNKQIADDPFQTFIDNSKVNWGTIPAFLKRRKDFIENSSSAFNIFEQNMLAMSYVFSNMGQRSMAEAMKLTMEAESGGRWADENSKSYNTIKFFADSLIRHIDQKPEMTASTEALRNMGMIATGSIALIFALPRSAVTNLLGGFSGLLAQFGFKNFIETYTEFKDAKTGDATEQLVYDIIEKNTGSSFGDTGKMSEFIKNSSNVDINMDNFAVSLTSSLRDTMFKLYDVTTGKGALGLVPYFQKIFSMRGSENILRMQAAPIMYKKVLNEFSAMKYADPSLLKKTDKELQPIIEDIYNKNKVDTYYEMNAALGDFNREVKPMWQWAMLKNPKNIKDVMVGAAANLWGAFRTVQMLTLNFTTKLAIKSGNEFKASNPETQINENAGKLDYTFSFAGILLQMILDMGAWALGYKTIKSSMLNNVNPVQELSSVFKGTLGMYSLATNSLVTEDVADEGIKMAIGVAGGLFAGNYLQDIYDQFRGNPEGIDPLHAFENIPKYINIPGAIHELHKGVTTNEYYDLIRKTKEPLNNANNMLNYSNAWIRLASDLIGVDLTIKGATNEDTQRIRSAQTKKMYKLLMSSFVGSFYNPYTQAQNKYYDDYRTTNLFYKLKNEIKYKNQNNFDSSVQQRMLKQIERYGKIYTDSFVG